MMSEQNQQGGSGQSRQSKRLTIASPTPTVPITPCQHVIKLSKPIIQPSPLPKRPSDKLAVLILLAGKSYKWEGSNPRQLRLIGGETILNRIIRQVHKSNHEPIIITHRDDIRSATPDLEHFNPQYHRTIAETWLYTRELWQKQTAILLGDVIYGPATILGILGYQGPMMMVGNNAEIFAFTFSEKVHNKIAEILYCVNRETGLGTPWFIYRRWCGFPYTSGQRESKVFHRTWDRTADIDSENEYTGAKKIWG